MGIYTQAVQQLYVAYFNRPADTSGLQYWENVVAAQDGDTSAVSAAFAQSDEYLATYKGLSNSQLVNQVYMNLFGRPAEPGGLAYWTPLLDQHLLTIDNVTTGVSRGALGSDAVAYRAKVTVATAFTSNLDSFDRTQAYMGDQANQLLKNFLGNVKDVTSLDAAIMPANLRSVIDKVMAIQHNPPAMVQSLTIGIDEFPPKAGNDTFFATNATLTTADRINGGDGFDTLNLRVSGVGSYAVPATVSIKNVETANIVGDAAITADTRTWSGLNSLIVAQSGGGQIRAANTTQVAVIDNALGAGNININGGGSINVTAKGNTSGNIVVGAETLPNGAVTIVNTITGNNPGGNIIVSGNSTVAIIQTHEIVPATTNTTVTVFGSADLTVTDNALGKLKVISGQGNITFNNAVPNSVPNSVPNPPPHNTSLVLNLEGGTEIKSFTDLNNSLTQLTLDTTFADATLENIRSASLQLLNIKTIDNSGGLKLGLAGAPGVKNITVSGLVGLVLDVSQSGVEQIDASRNSGAGILTLDGQVTNLKGTNNAFSVTSDAGGFEFDAQTIIKGSVVSKSILLGRGNDLVTLTPTAFSGTGRVDGGDGFNTLKIDSANAVKYANMADFTQRVTGFEALKLDNSPSNSPGQMVDIAKLGDFSRVYTEGGNNLILNNWDSRDTLYLTGSGKSYTIANPAFADGSNDTFNLALRNPFSPTSPVFARDGISVRDIEKINVDTGFSANSLTFLNNSAKTISLTGGSLGNFIANDAALRELNVNLDRGLFKFVSGALDNDVTINIESIFGSFDIDVSGSSHSVTFNGMNGGDGPTKITVGAGNNLLQARNGDLNVVISSPGSALDGGGAGLGSFTTIKKTPSGPFLGDYGNIKITFADHGTELFKNTKLSLAGNATLQDYANAAVHQGGNGSVNGIISWFQFQGDTYLVENRHDASAASAGFVKGTDIVVKLVGLLDLQNAQLTGETLKIV